FRSLGDYYRGCQHYVMRYYNGEVQDCMNPDCKTSSVHRHKTARSCPCVAIKNDDRRVVNKFHFKCEPCTELERSSRGYR
ncbi:hypothetical protein SCHPADRAFT_828025, partial [Schizopora paradoxa]